MSEPIWVCDTGEYEQRYTFGAWHSLDAAVRSVKDTHKPPYVVVWEELDGPDKWDQYTLTGHFSAVSGYSTQHTAYYTFTTWELSDD